MKIYFLPCAEGGVTREQVRVRDFTIRGKKAEAVFRRWATGDENN